MRIVNITMEAYSAVLLVLMLVSGLVKKQKLRQNRWFVLILIFTLTGVVSDMAANIFDENPSSLAIIITKSGSFLSYVAVSLMGIAFLAYILSNMNVPLKRNPQIAVIVGIAVALCSSVVVMAFVNLWNGMLYTIDAVNVYRWGAFYIVPPLCGLTMHALIFAIILINRRLVSKTNVVFFSLYLICPLIGTIVGYLYPDLILLLPLQTITLLLIDVHVRQEQEKLMLLTEAELSDSRMETMISQIQPHFLYNSLTAAMDLCDTDPELAKRTIADFGKYLRGNLDSLKLKHPIPFEKELHHIEVYLRLEKARFQEKLNVVYDIQATDFCLPALSVQPLVENAVKHGLSKSPVGGTVTIATNEDEKRFFVTVTDNGGGFDAGEAKQDETHIGLNNIEGRLRKMVGATLTVTSEIGIGTTASIKIPKGGNNCENTCD